MAELEFEPRLDFAALGNAPPSGCPSRTCWYFSGEDPCVHGEHLYSLVCSIKELTLPGAGTGGREGGGRGEEGFPSRRREVRPLPRWVSSKLYDSGLTFTVLTSRFLLIFREAFLVGQQRWASLASPHCHRKYRPESGANRSFNESPAFTEQVDLRTPFEFLDPAVPEI